MSVREQLNALTGEALEAVVAQVWEARGWRTEGEGNGDRGVDVRATKTKPYPETEVIQVKYRAPDKTVGSEIVQQYTGLAEQEDADKILFVTNTTFTDQAYDIARRNNVKLIDGDGLADLITAYGPPERYKPHLDVAAATAAVDETDSIAHLVAVALDRTRNVEEREHAITVLGTFGDAAVSELSRIASEADGSSTDRRAETKRLRRAAREQIEAIRG